MSITNCFSTLTHVAAADSVVRSLFIATLLEGSSHQSSYPKHSLKMGCEYLGPTGAVDVCVLKQLSTAPPWTRETVPISSEVRKPVRVQRLIDGHWNPPVGLPSPLLPVFTANGLSVANYATRLYADILIRCPVMVELKVF